MKIRMTKFKALLGALTLWVAVLSLPTVAQAGLITNKLGYILYEGAVEPGDAKRLMSVITATGVTTVHLKSSGGAAIEGYGLGLMFKELGISVVVAEGDYCLSACAIAFLGGKDKIIDGFIGFHVAWADGKGTLTEGMRAGQWLGSFNAIYHFDAGYTAQLTMIVARLTDPSTFLVFDNMQDLDLFKMVDGNYTSYVDLPKNWLADHTAGGTRLQLLMEGL